MTKQSCFLGRYKIQWKEKTHVHTPTTGHQEKRVLIYRPRLTIVFGRTHPPSTCRRRTRPGMEEGQRVANGSVDSDRHPKPGWREEGRQVNVHNWTAGSPHERALMTRRFTGCGNTENQPRTHSTGEHFRDASTGILTEKSGEYNFMKS